MRGNVLVELSRGFIVNVNGRNTFTVLRPEDRGKTRNRGKDKTCTGARKLDWDLSIFCKLHTSEASKTPEPSHSGKPLFLFYAG